ncbi:hypothetical protein GEV33_006171 [Tenebrio molitor]|uniref:Uncharacterized protein n=1 Tax=Tenebrio molitor TaxID=7067 RepID=A0A8J6LKK0_TENMO|nr:hypothetical protein GEV33_006171 [Tenebrio molitor]
MADVTSDQIFYSNHADKKRDQILLQSIVHTAKMPDKNIWPSLLQALNYWFKIPNEKFEAINNIIKLWRVTNYVQIDVEENALLRDGAATANSLYGNSDAINSIYYSLFIILEKIRDFGRYDVDLAIKLATEHFIEFHKGKGMELNWRDFLKCPTEEEYLKMAIRNFIYSFSSLERKKSISEGELAAEAFQSVFRDTDGKLRDGTVRMGGKTDDAEDDSELRGGIPTAHLIYGTARTFNAANYVTFIEVKKLLDLQEPKVIDYFVEVGLELFRSQGMDIYYRDQFICPTENDYIEFAGGKKLRDEAIDEMNKIGKNPRMEEIFKIVLNDLESEVYCDC